MIAKEMQRRTGEKFYLITSKEELTLRRLSRVKPRTIFFPHWSFIIPSEVFSQFECVIFHMTDVPFGRGGSPLQNLMSRGIRKTKLTALRAVEHLDAGDVYLKKPLSLHGKAQEIYDRMTQLAMDMMVEIVKTDPVARPQRGKVTLFKRRKPEQSDIKDIASLNALHDHIRMLDADSYPKAYLETRNLRLEFSDAVLRKDSVRANVSFMIRKKSS